MIADLLHLFFLSLMFLGLFALAEIIYHVFKVKAEITRKIVHVGTGLLTLLFPLMLSTHWSVMVICSSFLVLLIISLQFHLLQSINKIDRFSLGSVLYPVAVYICFLAYEQHGFKLEWFYLPVLTMALCDPIAALTGKNLPWKKYHIGKETKTLSGSLAFAITAFILYVVICTILGYQGHLFMAALLYAVFTSLSEALSRKGVDNLSIPAMSLFLVWLFQEQWQWL